MIDDSLLYFVQWGPLPKVLLFKKDVIRWIRTFKDGIHACKILIVCNFLAAVLIIDSMMTGWESHRGELFFIICSIVAAAIVAILIVNFFTCIKDMFLLKAKLAEAVELLSCIKEREKREKI